MFPASACTLGYGLGSLNAVRLHDLEKAPILDRMLVPGSAVSRREPIGGSVPGPNGSVTVGYRLRGGTTASGALLSVMSSLASAGVSLDQVNCRSASFDFVGGSLSVRSTEPGVKFWIAAVNVFIDKPSAASAMLTLSLPAGALPQGEAPSGEMARVPLKVLGDCGLS